MSETVLRKRRDCQSSFQWQFELRQKVTFTFTTDFNNRNGNKNNNQNIRNHNKDKKDNTKNKIGRINDNNNNNTNHSTNKNKNNNEHVQGDTNKNIKLGTTRLVRRHPKKQTDSIDSNLCGSGTNRLVFLKEGEHEHNKDSAKKTRVLNAKPIVPLPLRAKAIASSKNHITAICRPLDLE